MPMWKNSVIKIFDYDKVEEIVLIAVMVMDSGIINMASAVDL